MLTVTIWDLVGLVVMVLRLCLIHMPPKASIDRCTCVLALRVLPRGI
jgi:hypothetical protein